MNSKKNTLIRDIGFFKSIRALCSAALLAATAVVLAYICKAFTFTPSLRLTFENLPLILSGFIFGPFIGSLTGIVSDLVSTAATYGFGGINPILTVGAASVGLVSGLVSHFILIRKTNLQIILSTYAAHIIANMLIKSAGLYLYYSTPLPELMLRVVLYLGIAAAESFLLINLLKSKGIRKAIGGIIK